MFARSLPIQREFLRQKISGQTGYHVRTRTFGLIFVALAAIAAPAYAHHSFAMFDSETTMEIQGSVAELQWTNPHAWLLVNVENEAGEVVLWSFEMGPPGSLARAGFRPRTVVAGDEVTVTMHPLKDGSPGGQFLSVILPDGTSLGE
jgi:hypothetical protein